MTNNINLYIHIPFCEARCNYCGFFTRPGYKHRLPAYFQALETEIRSYSLHLKNYTVSSIYFGGGTPSLVPAEYIAHIIAVIRETAQLSSDCELTLEANPETIEREKLTQYKNCGINRISLGLQAAQDRLLVYLGRRYSMAEFEKSYQLVKQAGFENISLDLIFGIPTQTSSEWEESLQKVLELGPQHIACYSLELDKDSFWGRLHGLGKFPAADERLDRKMYSMARKHLTSNGFLHYEISNFARSGYECRHNLALWNYSPYIGFGASAHTFFEGARYNNIYSIEKYIALTLKNGTSAENRQQIKESESIQEFIMLQLRLSTGINLAKFKEMFRCDFSSLFAGTIENLSGAGLIKLTEKFLTLTAKGQDLENYCLQQFWESRPN